VPLVRENYYLACLKTALDQPATQALLSLLRTAHWQRRLDAMQGYRSSHSGEVLSLREMLPWWSFKPRRSESLRKAGPTAAAGSS
jgi:putative molybdopterin biosynthesis protein